MTKQFKLVHIGANPTEGDQFAHLLIGADADCYRVLRSRGHHSPRPWQLGDVIEVELTPVLHAGRNTSAMEPFWLSVGASKACKKELMRPYAAVAKAWGKEQADQCLRPDASASNVEPSPRFSEDDFIGSFEMSCKEKADIGNAFVAFAENNCDRSYFTADLYTVLMKMFRFESLQPERDVELRAKAFHRWWFTKASNRLAFFRKIAESNPSEDALSDLRAALRSYVIQRLLHRATATFRNATAMRERGVLRDLLRKYGVPEDFMLPRQR